MPVRFLLLFLKLGAVQRRVYQGRSVTLLSRREHEEGWQRVSFDLFFKKSAQPKMSKVLTNFRPIPCRISPVTKRLWASRSGYKPKSTSCQGI